jgi:hypothetical protein
MTPIYHGGIPGLTNVADRSITYLLQNEKVINVKVGSAADGG